MKAVNPVTGKLIKRISQHRGLRPGQLAGKLKLQPAQVSQIFSGQKKVDGPLAFDLESILKVSASDLLGFAEKERRGEGVSAEDYLSTLFPKKESVNRGMRVTAEQLRDEFIKNAPKFCSTREEQNFFCIGSQDDEGNFVLPEIEGPSVILTLNDAVWVDEEKDNSEIDGAEIVVSKGDELRLFINETIYLDQESFGRLEVHPEICNSGLVYGQLMPITLVASEKPVHLDLYIRNDVDRPITLRKSMPIFRYVPI